MIPKCLRRRFPAECLSWPTVEADATASSSSWSAGTGRCLWGSTDVGGHWCSRWCPAAMDCVGRRSRWASRVLIRSWTCCAISAPGPRSAIGAVARQRDDAAAMASRTASAPWPASAGPFFTRGCPKSVMRGRCNSIVNRVVRSTRVPIAELSSPTNEIAFPVTGHRAVCSLRGPLRDHDLGANERLAASTCASSRHPSARPVRKHVTSSRRRAPRPCT